jgi:hypothetical protein
VPTGLPIEAYFTSGKLPTPALALSLSRFNVIAAETKPSKLPV